jgi:hypothetical protein
VKLRYLAIALVLLGAFASDSWGKSQTNPHVQVEQKTNDTQAAQSKGKTQNNKVDPAPVAAPSPSPNHGDEKSTSEKQDSVKESAEGTEYWTFGGYKVKITDGLLVLFTLGLVVIGVFQAIFLSGTLKATAIAATAAKSAAEVIPNLERAYLFFSATTCDEFKKDMSFVSTSPDIFNIKYKYKNSGRTPALVKKVQTGTGYFKDGFPEKDEFIFDHELETVLAIGSDKDAPQNTAEIRIMGDEYEWAKKGVGRIFFLGQTNLSRRFRDKPRDRHLL